MTGESVTVRDALIQIILRLRDDILKDRDGGHNSSLGAEPLYSSGAGLSMPPLPSVASLGYNQRPETGSGVGMVSSGNIYGYGSLSVCQLFEPMLHFYPVIGTIISHCVVIMVLILLHYGIIYLIVVIV